MNVKCEKKLHFIAINFKPVSILYFAEGHHLHNAMFQTTPVPTHKFSCNVK